MCYYVPSTVSMILFFLVFPFLFSISYCKNEMGVKNACDDAKHGIEIDFDPRNFSVFQCSKSRLKHESTPPTLYKIPNLDPRTDKGADHFCLTHKIEYKESPPLRGNHRPNWAVYGEYAYLPTQRWLHNLEHGSIVMLYHPCADEKEIEKLRNLVRGCLFRHIITPYSHLSEKMPLALLSWGAKMEFSLIDNEAEKKAVEFIKTNARHGPEEISKNGKYNQTLLVPAKVVSNGRDKHLCPNYKEQPSGKYVKGKENKKKH